MLAGSDRVLFGAALRNHEYFTPPYSRRVCRRSRSDAILAAGDRIELAANLQRLQFFDLATGQAIRDDG